MIASNQVNAKQRKENMRHIIKHKVEVEFIIDNRIVNATKHRGEKHSYRQKRDEKIKMRFDLFGQAKGDGHQGEHKRADICHGKGVLKIPIVKTHIPINNHAKANIRNEHQATEQHVNEFLMAYIFH